MKNNIDFFLDSGAFSAFTKGIEINIIEYCKFIKDNIDYIDQYAVLDAIGNPEKTLQNQKVMEKEGLNPIPCFHYGEDEKYLKYYISNYEYISLGGMVPISTKDLIVWLDNLYTKYFCDNNGYVKLKIHGFGLTSFDLLFRYPWYSVDSTTWIGGSKFGIIFLPYYDDEQFLYNKKPTIIHISDKSVEKRKEGKHYYSLSEREKDIVLKYLKEKKVTIEEILFDYNTRVKLCVSYFLDVEKCLSKKETFFAKKLLKEFFI